MKNLINIKINNPIHNLEKMRNGSSIAENKNNHNLHDASFIPPFL